MKYDKKAKPTVYNNIQFRSILEAKWACWFDIVGWKYQYEPFEIGGRLPDFILYCSNNDYEYKQVIVEVKPFVYCTPQFYKDIFAAYKDYPAFILVLNETPFNIGWSNYIELGIELARHEDRNRFFEDHMYMKCPDDFSSVYMSFDPVMKGQIQRKDFIQVQCQLPYKEEDYHEILANWRDAASIVQFPSY